MSRLHFLSSSWRSFAVLFVILLGSGLVACEKKDKSEIVVAEVGDRTITLDYFERKMNSMDPQFLPPDINSRAGREELLEVMVNKEVMAIKAEQLGMGADGQADEQAEVVAELKAVQAMRDDVIMPAQNPTEEQIYDYYENFARVLTVSYMLFDHLEDALEAKGLIEGGETWRTVAERFEAGDPGPTKDWKLQMKYGTIADDLEKAVFELPVGEVSDPIDSIYGWFVIRVESQKIERVAPLDTLHDKIAASVVKQESALLIKSFVEEVFEEFSFTLNEEALQKVYDALPPDVPLTPPPPIEELEPLALEPADLDMLLMSYAEEVWTLRRFSDFYDESSALGRPKQRDRLGGLRRFLKEIGIRELMPLAARSRGYLEADAIRDEFKERREQAMVTRLHNELVKGEVEVSPEEVEAYWEQHKDEFVRPERRSALAVICESESKALAAQRLAQSGAKWTDVIEQYCVDDALKQVEGNIGAMTEKSPGPFTVPAFQLGAVGDVLYPTKMEDGRWLVLKLTELSPREEPSFADMKLRVGRMIEAEKEEALFQRKVEEWKSEMDVRRYPDRLMDAVYDPQPREPGRISVGGV